MRAGNFLRIFAVTLALSGYAAWSRSEADGRRGEAPGAPSVEVGNRIPLLRLEEAVALWRKPDVVFVDVRAETDYALNHIPGAVHLAEEDFETRFAELKPRLEPASAVVVYCKSEDCARSLWVAIRLRNEGLTQTKIYPAGWNEWVLNGYPAYHAE